MIGRVLVYGVGERMTRRLAGAVVGSQTVVVFLAALVAFSLAKVNGQAVHTTYLWVGVALAVLCLVAAGTLRRPWGVTLGWLIQLACIVSTVILPMMLIVGVVFAALWATALVQGRKLDHLTAEYRRTHP